MGYVYFTEEQKERANTVDLKDFLERQGERLLRSGPEWRMSSDHSITIRGNRWYDHGSAGKGGAAIDFVIYYYGKTFPDAVSMLLGGEQGQTYRQSRKQEEVPRKPFALPAANGDMRRVFAYLCQTRGIDPEVASAFAHAHLLYESADKHNAVFVGKDRSGRVRHIHMRGTLTGSGFRQTLGGSEKAFSFHHTGSGRQLYVFEAPIDMLSYISLHPENWQENSYVALCGVGSAPIPRFLEEVPQLEEVVLCLDNDEAGHNAAMRIAGELLDEWEVEVSAHFPKQKDWNDELLHPFPEENLEPVMAM